MDASRPSPSLAAQAGGLVAWLLGVFAVAAIGAIASADAAAFYGQLSKPAWAPPSGLFGPVWTLLYALIGIAGWLVWRSPGRHQAPGWALYASQLAANALWSWLFFAWQRGALAAIEVLVLLVLIAGNVLAFRRHSRVAAWLLVPYLAWVAYASALTWAVWRANPGLL